MGIVVEVGGHLTGVVVLIQEEVLLIIEDLLTVGLLDLEEVGGEVVVDISVACVGVGKSQHCFIQVDAFVLSHR